MTFEKIRDLLAAQLSCDKAKITLESDLVADLGTDSLDVVEMLMRLEEEFSITVPDEKAAELKKVSDIVKYIDSVKK
jgi:acyl carrier protein